MNDTAQMVYDEILGDYDPDRPVTVGDLEKAELRINQRMEEMANRVIAKIDERIEEQERWMQESINSLAAVAETLKEAVASPRFGESLDETTGRRLDRATAETAESIRRRAEEGDIAGVADGLEKIVRMLKSIEGMTAHVAGDAETAKIAAVDNSEGIFATYKNTKNIINQLAAIENALHAMGGTVTSAIESERKARQKELNSLAARLRPFGGA